MFYTGHMVCITIPILIYMFIESPPKSNVIVEILKIIWLPVFFALHLRTWWFWIAVEIVRNKLQNLLAGSVGKLFFKGLRLGFIDLLILSVVGLPFYIASRNMPFIYTSTIWQFIIFGVFTILSLFCTMKVFLILDKRIANTH